MHVPLFGVLVASAIVLAPPPAEDAVCFAGVSQPGGGAVQSASEPTHAQQPPEWLDRLQQWLAAVGRHEPGKLDQDVSLVAMWPASDIQSVLTSIAAFVDRLVAARADVKSSGGRVFSLRGRTFPMAEAEILLGLTEEEGRRGDCNRILKRAALLHTDVVVLGLKGPSAYTPVGLAVAIDGQHVGFIHPAAHLQYARVLLDLVRPDPAQDAMVRLWYLATAVHLQGKRMLGDADTHLQHALKLLPQDADLLLARGCLRETFASPGVQRAVASAKVPRGAILIAEAPVELRQAEDLFRGALKRKPDLTEARVRLAHVIGLQGKHREAARELETAVASTREDPALRYYALLFLGRETEVLGQRDAARGYYQRAATLYPGAQSARLALSQLARGAGDRPAALRALQDVLSLAAGDSARYDPWWGYHQGPRYDGDRLLAEVRKPFLPGGRR